MIRGVLFDLDGTLFDRDSTVEELLADQHQRFAPALGTLPRETYVARLLELDAHGHGDKTIAYRQMAGAFALPDTLGGVLEADFWQAYHRYCRCFPDVLPALTELRRRGLRLGIITNGKARIQKPTIARLGLSDLMDTIHVSECEGVRKPDSEIFRRALLALGLRGDEAWYVGDDPEVDVRGATNAGLIAVWRRTNYWPSPDVPHHAVNGLDELLPLIPATT